MNRRDTEILIDRDGNVTVRVFGAKGKQCLEATQWLEEGLGDVAEREMTSEYYDESSGIASYADQ